MEPEILKGDGFEVDVREVFGVKFVFLRNTGIDGFFSIGLRGLPPLPDMTKDPCPIQGNYARENAVVFFSYHPKPGDRICVYRDTKGPEEGSVEFTA
jgi:hypothetical protein